MSNLLDIAERFKNVADLIDNEEIEPALLEGALAEIEGEISQKLTNITRIIDKGNSDIVFIEKEIERLKGRKSYIENINAKLKDYIRTSMVVAGKKNIKTPFYTWTVAKTAGSVKILNENEIPPMFIKSEVVTKIDKKSLSERLRAGENIDGAILEIKESLRIK